MILFAKDYARFPTAVVDTTTKNQSFINLAAKYRKMGIKNYAFILTTLNPRLIGVDPLDPNLSMELKAAIKIECKHNPWYFLREVAQVKGQGGIDKVPFQANRGNIALFWCFLNHIDICLIQPRQTGKSVGADFIAEWVLMFAGYNSSINLVTLTEKLRVQNVERLKAAMKLLPPYLVDIRPDDADNTQVITYKSLKNKFNSFVNQSSEDAARNTGRGFTSAVNLMDEWAYFEHVLATMAGALGSSLAAREVAAANNSPYGNIFTTTAGKRDSRDGKIVYDMIFGGMTWSETLFDSKDERDAQRIVKLHTTGKKQIVNATFSHRQLGKTDLWLSEVMATLGLSDDEADRDLMNIWTNGSASSPLSIELNKIISSSARSPDWVESSEHGYCFNWYIPKEVIPTYMMQNKTVLGIDTSDVVNRDATTFVLRDARTLAVIGSTAISEGNLMTLAGWFADFMVTYKNVTGIIEKKSSAQTFIDCLMLKLPSVGINPFERMYNRVVDNRDTRADDFAILMNPNNLGNQIIYNKYKNEIGFITTADSRMTLYREILQASAKGSGNKVYDERLVREITGLVVKNGKIDHKASGHDDTVISWLLGHWLLAHGRNLDVYGLDALQVMSMMTDARKGDDPKELQGMLQRRALRKAIDQTVGDLRNATVGGDIARLEHRLRILAEQSKFDGGEVFSLDALKRETEEARRARETRNRYAGGNRAANDNSIGGAPIVPWYMAA